MKKHNRTKMVLSLPLIAIILLLSIKFTPKLNAQRQQLPSKPSGQLEVSVNENNLRKEVRASIDNSVKSIQGLTFPITRGQRGQVKIMSSGVCAPGDISRQDKGINISVWMAKHQPTSKCEVREALYGAPDPNWVAFKYYHTLWSQANNASFDLGQLPANLEYLTDSQFNTSYESMKSFIGGLDVADWVKADLNVKMEGLVKGYIGYKNKVSSNATVVSYKAKACGNGYASGLRSWHEGWVDIDRMCVVPEIKDAAALEKTLKTWVEDRVDEYDHTKVKYDKNLFQNK